MVIASGHFESNGDSARPRADVLVAYRLEITRRIAMVDALLNEQVNAILHHPDFQQLEAGWRGLRRLVDQAAETEDEHSRIEIRVLHLPWADLASDLERAIEFDQSRLFWLVYEMSFGVAGGRPFGLLVGNYEIGLRRRPGGSTDDITLLSMLSEVAAASFAPFVAGTHPSLFQLNSFLELERSLDLRALFAQPEYMKWRALRGTEDARFIGLALPRVLLRPPYGPHDSAADVEFCFREEPGGPDARRYLWGNAAFAFASIAIRSYQDSGWLADIRGVRRGEAAAGLVTALPRIWCGTDRAGLIPRPSVDLVIPDGLERTLSDQGFMSLCHCWDTPFCAFYSNTSIQRPKRYDDIRATMSARISSMLQYILCASRFAHFLKLMARDKLGTFAAPHELQDYLNAWLNDYRAPQDDVNDDVKARFPLREAEVEVYEIPGRPGAFGCNMRLRPHYQLDSLAASVRLTTTME